MIWQNPWAFLGLLTLAVPVIIHLLGRRNARVTKFPTLRFVGASRSMATRWTRLSDIGLLLVRMGIIAAAVVALAEPLLLTDERTATRNRAIARAIIVDTSASMNRMAASGAVGSSRGRTGGGAAVETGREVARREAAALAGDAATSVIVQTSSPSQAVRGAVAWLETRQGRREVVVISDFQTGAVDEADFRGIPPAIGIGAVRVDVTPSSDPIELVSRQASAEIVTRLAPDSAGVDVEWAVRPEAMGGSDAADVGITILAGGAERSRADAAWTAAMSVSAAVAGPRYPIAIVLPGYEGRAALIRDAQAMSEPWMGDVLARLGRDSILVAAARDAEVSDIDEEPSFVPVARTAAGKPVALAARGSVNGSASMLLFARVDAGSVPSAALIAAAIRASSFAAPVAELEPTTLSEQVVASWRRDAAMGPELATADSDLSDARWFWMLALILIGIESRMRRARREERVPEVARDRAA